jgi:hypothetical protein
MNAIVDECHQIIPLYTNIWFQHTKDNSSLTQMNKPKANIHKQFQIIKNIKHK